MSCGRVGDWILTRTGVRFWPLDARPDEIRLFDVSGALSNTCRFAGHCRKFYSVAEHSVRVARYLEEHYTKRLAMAGLLHDAAEAYLGDIARPWKRFLWLETPSWPLRSFKTVEDSLLRVVYQGLEVAYPSLDEWELIHHADEVLLATEYRDLMPQHPDWSMSKEWGWEVLPTVIEVACPEVAEVEFRTMFHRLKAQC